MSRFLQLALTIGFLSSSVLVLPADADEKAYGSLKGEVIGAHGKPVAGETVRLVMPYRLLHYSYSEKTKEDGTFLFERVPAQDYLLVTGLADCPTCWVTVAADETEEVNVKLGPSEFEPLKGTVIADDKPVDCGTIHFVPLDCELSRSVWPPVMRGAEIQKDGRYSIAAIRPGRYLICVDRPPMLSSSMPLLHSSKSSRKPEQEQEKPRHWLQYLRIAGIKPGVTELNIVAEDSVLKGTLTDYTGKPVDGLMLCLIPSEVKTFSSLFLMSAREMTDANGFYSFKHVAPGHYDLLVSQGMYSDDSPVIGTQLYTGIEVAGKVTRLNWQLARAVQIDAAMEFDGGDSDMPYFMVISERQSKLRSISDHTFCPKNSLVSRPIVFPPGQYKVFAMTKTSDYSCEAWITDFNEHTKLNPELVPAGRIDVILKGSPRKVAGRTIRLYDSTGKEIPRLYDPLWSYDQDLCRAVVLPTCEAGRTSIGWLRPGQYRVSVDGMRDWADATVKAGETTAVHIALEESR